MSREERQASEPLTCEVKESSGLPQATDRFLAQVGAWATRVMDAHPDGVTSNSHDGLTFMTPWAVHVRAMGDARIVPFMRTCRDNTKAHLQAAGEWLDGYWRRQEAHHGTEHFDLFLHTLWTLDPGDAETVRQFEDAAEHVGNWKAGVPEWFDWRRGVFRSFYLGAKAVGAPAVNVPEHVRFLSLALKAYDMTGNARYLDFARLYGGRWADAILEKPELPAGLDESRPVYALEGDETAYRRFAGAAPADMVSDLARAENLLASGVPDAMLRLWQLTGEDRFHDAAMRMTDVAAAELASPIAWQAQAAVRRYRDLTRSDRYDEQVRALTQECARRTSQLTIVPAPTGHRPANVMGMRRDKPDWLDDRGAPAPSPLLWTLCALVRRDEAWLTRAVDLGAAHFRLAERAFGDIATHGCGSRSLSAVARGHGRLNGAGVVSEVLAPAVEFLKGKR